MKFAIYKAGALHAVVESEPGKAPASVHAEALRELNAADSVVPIESEAHEAVLRSNAATVEAIGGGFEFRGHRFSLSLASQITISNAYTIRASLPYPIDWANIDDTGFVSMKSAKDIEAFYAAATTAVLLARTAGNAAKKVAIGG